jgi:hypothetical protein
MYIVRRKEYLLNIVILRLYSLFPFVEKVNNSLKPSFVCMSKTFDTFF